MYLDDRGRPLKLSKLSNAKGALIFQWCMDTWQDEQSGTGLCESPTLYHTSS